MAKESYTGIRVTQNPSYNRCLRDSFYVEHPEALASLNNS